MDSRQDMTQAEAEEVLGLPDVYGKKELRQAYTAKARIYHPDNAARNGIPASVAQASMVKVNKANSLLKRYFDANPSQQIHRDKASVGAAPNSVGVHFEPDGSHARRTAVDDALFWDEQGRARGTVQEDRAAASADAPGHRLRRFLLGPWLLRLILVALFGWLWWRTFPFLPSNSAAYHLDDPTAQVDWVLVTCRAVYPTYLLLYELFGGGISGVLRELLNGLVSLITRVHVEVRPKGAYRSSLSSLFSKQWYGALMLPLALYLGTIAHAQTGDARWIWWALCALVAIDSLLAFFGTGIVDSLAERVADGIERTYVRCRMRLLKYCGQWDGAASGASGRHAAHARR